MKQKIELPQTLDAKTKTYHIVFGPGRKVILYEYDLSRSITVEKPEPLLKYIQRAPYRKNILMVNYRHLPKYVIADIVMKRKPKVIRDIERLDDETKN